MKKLVFLLLLPFSLFAYPINLDIAIWETRTMLDEILETLESMEIKAEKDVTAAFFWVGKAEAYLEMLEHLENLSRQLDDKSTQNCGSICDADNLSSP
jgi:hypothetical protein